MSDYLEPVMKPRNGEPSAIEEMNARMMLFHPAMREVVREDQELRNAMHKIVSRDVSVGELFRSIISRPE
jgi:hypothetical protein